LLLTKQLNISTCIKRLLENSTQVKQQEVKLGQNGEQQEERNAKQDERNAKQYMQQHSATKITH
jgi:hypothetical protein